MVNLGGVDKTIRLAVAVVQAVVAIAVVSAVWLMAVLLLLAVVAVVTSLVNYCPLYQVLGINTCSTKNS